MLANRLGSRACQLSTGQQEFGSSTEGRINLPPVGSPEREAVVETAIKQMRELGFPKFGASLFSAHQMGTCRMGTDIRSSFIKESGENWEVQGLYVADASTFPTSSGANPMITTMAIAHRIAQGLKDKLARESSEKQPAVLEAPKITGLLPTVLDQRRNRTSETSCFYGLKRAVPM